MAPSVYVVYGEKYLRYVNQHGYPTEANRQLFNIKFYDANEDMDRFKKNKPPLYVKGSPELSAIFADVLADFQGKYKTCATSARKSGGKPKGGKNRKAGKKIGEVDVVEDSERMEMNEEEAIEQPPKKTRRVLTKKTVSDKGTNSGETGQQKRKSPRLMTEAEKKQCAGNPQKAPPPVLQKSKANPIRTSIQQSAPIPEEDDDDEPVYLGERSLIAVDPEKEYMDKKIMQVEKERDLWKERYYETKEVENTLAARVAQLEEELQNVKLKLMEDNKELMNRLLSEKERSIQFLSKK